jgi:hypothetical protein
MVLVGPGLGASAGRSPCPASRCLAPPTTTRSKHLDRNMVGLIVTTTKLLMMMLLLLLVIVNGLTAAYARLLHIPVRGSLWDGNRPNLLPLLVLPLRPFVEQSHRDVSQKDAGVPTAEPGCRGIT